MGFPNDGRTVMLMQSGYHHYLDTGMCTDKKENKFFIIDGAVVRLIRFGSSITTVQKTKLYNVTVTVDSGELWYLNTSHEIDEFAGALTLVFNNGTYSNFIQDYSLGKIVPQKGKYIVVSPKYRGMKLIPEDVPGHFTVSGNLCAYCVSSDGKSAFYSICSHIELSTGISNILYTDKFSESLLPSPPKGMKWSDDGKGKMRVVPKNEIQTVYVKASENADGCDLGNGSFRAPFGSIKKAAAFLKSNGGKIIICGKVPFSAQPHNGTICFEGEDENSCLVFDRNAHYYLQGDTAFKNIAISMTEQGSSSTMLVSNGHSLIYGSGVTSEYGILSCTGEITLNSKQITIKNIYLISGSDNEKSSSKNCCIFFCKSESESPELIYGSRSFRISAASAVVVPDRSQCKFNFSKSKRSSQTKILAAEFTALGMAIKAKNIDTLAYSFFGDIISRFFDASAETCENSFKQELSAAIEQIISLNTAKRAIAVSVNEYIMQNYASVSSVDALSNFFHMNRSYLERAYKKAYGIGLKKEILRCRCNAAITLMHKGYRINEVAKMVGYENAASFSRAFKNETGASPKNISYKINH